LHYTESLLHYILKSIALYLKSIALYIKSPSAYLFWWINYRPQPRQTTWRQWQQLEVNTHMTWKR